MDLPKRTRQQESEAQSYAILLYKLRGLGIFRNLTENDYGIDFELELINSGQVSGQSVKIQVKSAEKLRLRKDKTPSVGGIKQSTLVYWCELSYRTNVIAYAVDLDSETIYVSRNLFWQATQAIDGSASSKSISFLPSGKDGDLTAKVATLMWAFAPTAADHVYAHTLALRRLGDFLQLFGDAFHYDAGTPVEGTTFHDLIEVSRILLWSEGDGLWSDKKDRRNWSNPDYWIAKSEADNWDGLSCYAAQPILSTIMPALVACLQRYREWVLNGKYYWANRNPQFLALVYEAVLPGSDEPEDLINWGRHYEQHLFEQKRMYPASYFIDEARKPPDEKSSTGPTTKTAKPAAAKRSRKQTPN